jgi:hypothetical protein
MMLRLQVLSLLLFFSCVSAEHHGFSVGVDIVPKVQLPGAQGAEQKEVQVAKEEVGEYLRNKGRKTPNKHQIEMEKDAEDAASSAARAAVHIAPAAAAEGVLSEAAHAAYKYEMLQAKSETNPMAKTAELAVAKAMQSKANEHAQREEAEIRVGRAGAEAYVKLQKAVNDANTEHMTLTKLIAKVGKLRTSYRQFESEPAKDDTPKTKQVLKKVGWKLFQIEQRAVKVGTQVVSSYDAIVKQSNALMDAEKRDLHGDTFKNKKSWMKWSTLMSAEKSEAANTKQAINSLKTNLRTNQDQLGRAQTELAALAHNVKEDVRLRFGGQEPSAANFGGSSGGPSGSTVAIGCVLLVITGVLVKVKGQ